MPQFSADQIRQFVLQNINNPAAISAAMSEYGLGVGDIQRAGGWSTEQMNEYMRGAQGQGVMFPGAERGYTPGNLDADTLRRVLAGETVDGRALGRGNYTGPEVTEANDQTGNPDNFEQVIYGDGGKDGWTTNHWNTWNTDGTYRGAGSADSDALAAMKFIAGAVGMYGAGTALNGAIAGGAAGGGSGMVNGAFVGEGALSGIPAWDGALTAAAQGSAATGALSTTNPGGAPTTYQLDPSTLTPIDNAMTAEQLVGSGWNIDPAISAGVGGAPGSAVGQPTTLQLDPSTLTPIDNTMTAQQLTGSGWQADPSIGTSTTSSFRPSDNYGEGMSGSQTRAFDGVLDATGSTTLATGASELAGVAPGVTDGVGNVINSVGSGLSDWGTRLFSGDTRAIQQGIGVLGLLNQLGGGGGGGSGGVGGGDGSNSSDLFGAYNGWTPQQQVQVDRFANRDSERKPWTPLAKYAEGGPVMGLEDEMGGGALGLIEGPGSGQSDSINAQLSDGEYVFDAETVSALGDGSNAAGAKVLDELRQRIRAHKRSAPASRIPPPAKAPEQYMTGGQ